MKTELTPQEYVIQPNAISQSIYSCGIYARRMIAMAMSLLPLEPTGKDEDYTVSFSVDNFFKSLGMESGKDGTNQYRRLMSALDECAGTIIKILEDTTGDYVVYTWFEEARLHTSGHKMWDLITMSFNPKLAKVIGDFRRQYAPIELIDFGKLQSRYGIRLYELALSYAGFAGKDGNPPKTWFFQNSIDELRLLFDIDHKKYKVVNDFRKKVIDLPIEEINAADIGIRIEPEYIRRGKYLIGFRFNCRWVERDEPLPVTPATETAQENEELMNGHPEYFEKLKAEELAKQSQQPELAGLFKNHPEWLEKAAESAALERLRELYPEAPKKRGRKKQTEQS